MTDRRVTKNFITIFLTVALALQGPVFVFAENLDFESAENVDYAMAEADGIITETDPKLQISPLDGEEMLWNALSREALEDFDALTEEQSIYGYIFGGDTYIGFEKPSKKAEDGLSFGCGDTVLIQKPYLNLAEHTLFYQVQTLIAEEGQNQETQPTTYVERAHLAASDSRFLNWEEKWLSKEMVAEMAEEANILEEDADDTDYTATLNGIEDFPASYQTKLAKLAAAHPNWTFVKFNTGINWNDAVNAEKGNRSWIHETAKDEYKGEHIEGKWYYATKKAIEYYMDPRNSLNEDYILIHEKLSFDDAYQSKSGTQAIVENSFMKGSISSANEGGTDSNKDKAYETYAEALYAYGKANGVSPYHLASRIIQEQGRNEKNPEEIPEMITGTNSTYPGVFNFFNIKASGSDVILNGLKHAKEQGWNTRRKSLKGGAAFISSGYINVGQNTKYLEKWDLIGPDLYTHQYMQNIQAPYTETKTITDMYASNHLMNRDFVFRIPVFSGMPGNASDDIETKPLTSIKLTPGTLNMYVGERAKLAFTYEPIATSEDPIPTWTSSDPTKVRVDEDGLLTAIARGEATITASVGTLTASCAVDVSMCKLYYHSSLPPYSVYSTGGSVPTAAVGETIAENPCPAAYRTVNSVFPEGEERDGFIFCGYFTEPEGAGKRLTADTVITGTLDIYPYYRPLGTDFTVKQPGDYVYTGDAIRPSVYVYDGSRRLTEGVDYKVKYENNKNRTEGDDLARILVTGKGNYSGTEVVKFKILPRDLSSDGVEATDVAVAFTGKDFVYGKPKVTDHGKKLKQGKDYTLSYPKKGEKGAYLLQGMHPIEITGTGNYTGTISVYEVISTKTPMKSCKVKVEKADYTGSELVPRLKVTDSRKRELRQGEDYILICPSDMVSAGEKTLRLQGIPEKGYVGTCSVKWKVSGTPIKSLNITGLKDVYYDPIYAPNGYFQDSLVITGERGTPLNGKEYSVAYRNNHSVGNARMIITGKGRYTGTANVKFKILPLPIGQSENLADGFTFEWNSGTDQIPYTKKATTPAFTLTYKGIRLRENVDYTVKYKNNKGVSSASAMLPPTVVIKGKGNYGGVVEKQFSIIERDFASLTDAFVVSTASYSATGKWKPSVTIMDTNGNLLKAGTDYTTPQFSYITATTVETKQGSTVRQAGDPVGKGDIVPAGTKISVSVTGRAPYSTLTLTKEFTVQRKLITKLDMVKITKPYTGSAVVLTENDIKLSDGQTELKRGIDYEIVEATYRNHIENGTATVCIQGIGNYSGVRVIKYKIIPRFLFW